MASSAFCMSVRTSGSQFSFTVSAPVAERRNRFTIPTRTSRISGRLARSVSVQMKMPRDLGSSVMTRWVQADSGWAGVVVPLGTEETAETTVPRERGMARGGAKRARVAVEVIEGARARVRLLVSD